MAEEVADISEQPTEAVHDITRGCFGTAVMFIGFLVTTLTLFILVFSLNYNFL